jgi:hypothetical protein
MNGFILIGIGVAVLIAFGLFSKGYTWAKSLYTATTGKAVDTSIDSKISQGFKELKSFKNQGLLRICRIDFKEMGDVGDVAAIDELIKKAAAWDDDPITVTETAANTATVTQTPIAQ